MIPKQPKKASKKKLATRLQYGALTYRKTKANGIEILLLTSRETKRWIIPKGWPIKGMKPCDSAAQEAYEEAGVRGTVGRRPIGKYTYDKRLEPPAKVVPCEVQIYALRVRRHEKSFPEIGQRELRWCQVDEAITIVDDLEVGTLIGKFVAQKKASANSDGTLTKRTRQPRSSTPAVCAGGSLREDTA